MIIKDLETIESCKAAALEVLLHNAGGPFDELPRTAGWGYPEPYTRDLMLSLPGIIVTGNQKLLESSQSCLLYTSPSPRDRTRSRMPSSA